MSVILVQVGQCGNQVGDALWTRLEASAAPKPAAGRAPAVSGAKQQQPSAPRACHVGPLFASDGFARCVLVDSEPKVVETLLERAPRRYRADNVVAGRSGRGNCWTTGYFGIQTEDEHKSERRARSSGGPADKLAQRPAFRVGVRDQRSADDSLLARTLRAVHDEAHRADDGGVEAIIVLHSLAGGTGSGFGSAVVENLAWHFRCRDGDGGEQPGKPPLSVLDEDDWLTGAYGETRKCQHVVSVCVAPRQHGETTVQSYNAVLTLQALLRSPCDAVIVLRNDGNDNGAAQQQSASARAQPAAAAAMKTLADVNRHFAAMLSAVLLGGVEYGAVGQLIANCCPLRRHRLLTLVPLAATQTGRLPPWATALHKSGVAASVYAATNKQPPADFAVGAFLALPPETHHGDAGPGSAVFATMASVVQAGPHIDAAVMVLNQGAELTRRVLFPLLRDAHLKTGAKAYLHGFSGGGALGRMLPRGAGSGGDDPIGDAAAVMAMAVSDVSAQLLQYPGTH
jgi:hypothetical protein